ncbi:MAG: ribosome maturation factor RimP [Pseudomonadota bacterium]
MTTAERKITAKVEEAAEPILRAEGLELVEVQYRRERSGWVLRLFIDRAVNRDFDLPGANQTRPAGSGVTLDDCVWVNREIGRVLDVQEVVPGSYTLEVSSPGLDRPLTKPADFVRFAGRVVQVQTAGPQGKRKIKGRLIALAEGMIELKVDDQVVLVPYEEVRRVKLVPELDWGKA